MTVELGLCVTAIVASIIIGYVFKMNTGLVAACFAFVIGVVFQGASATDVIANWPTNLAYFILICGLFFNFAVQNGTIEALGGKMLYLINGRAALIPWIVFVIFIATKSYKAKKMQVDRPKDFEPVQKKTFRLLITCSAVIVVCVTLGMLFPESEICQTLSAIGQPQIVMTFGAIIAMQMKVGPADKAVKALPVNTVLMISGFTMMMSVAQNAGLVDALAHVMSGNIPDVLLKPMFLVVAGCMSFFCSGTGVVFPLLFPIALPLSQATGINPGAIIVCMTAGSMLSSLSPFSTGGAMMLAGCPDQDKMSNQLIAVAVTALLSGAVLAFLGFFDLFAL